MIRIDLLPPEMKKAERTSPRVFLATVGLAALLSSTAAGLGYAWFGVVGAARNDVQLARETFDSKKPQAEYADRLEAEKQEYTSRLDHIKNFSNSRILWTKKLDQLGSLIDSPATADRHTVWLQSLTMKMNGGRDMGLNLKGRSASSEVRKLSNFHRDLSSGPFFAEFASISNPAGKVVVEDGFEPAEAWEFDFSLALKDPTQDPKKSAQDGARKAPAAGANRPPKAK